MHCGAGVLMMMENSEHFDFANSGLVKIDDMLFRLDAVASRKEIVPWPTGLWVLAEQFKCPRNRRLVGLRLLLSPSLPGKQRDAFEVVVSFKSESDDRLTGRHRVSVSLPGGTVPQLCGGCPPTVPA